MAEPDAGRPLAGRTALVTGASRGFGAATAVALGAAGAHLICAARTVGGLEETDDAVRAAGGSATLVPIDLSKLDQVDALGPSLAQRFAHLDIIVANAAMLGALSPIAYSDHKIWQRVFDLNLIANYRLVRSVDPLLRASDQGRIVFITDRVGHEPIAYWGAYAMSKAGLEMMARLYAAETAKTRLRVALFDPGPMATRLRGIAFPNEPEGTAPPPGPAAERLIGHLCSSDRLPAGAAAEWG